MKKKKRSPGQIIKGTAASVFSDFLAAAKGHPSRLKVTITASLIDQAAMTEAKAREK